VGFIVLIALTFLLMWFLVLRPQRRRITEQRSMVNALAPGQEVLTAGGMYGDVVEVGEDEVAIEIAPGVVVRVAMRAIAAVIPPDAYEEDEEPEDEAEVVPEPEDAVEIGTSPSGGIEDPGAAVEPDRR
jgi:preprotein translocase subunit YajC